MHPFRTPTSYEVRWGCICIPIILPLLNCLTLRTLNLPSLTTGTCASFWYWLKDQSFGLMADGLESRRRGLRYCSFECCCAKQRPAPKAAALPKRRGVRREWLKRPGVKRKAIVALVAHACWATCGGDGRGERRCVGCVEERRRVRQ